MNKYLKIAKEITLQHFNDVNMEIFLFGSRAEGTELEKSDIDIGLLDKKKVSSKIINKLHEKFEESLIPYHVDIIDFFDVDNEFKEIALNNKVVWKKKKNIN